MSLLRVVGYFAIDYSPTLLDYSKNTMRIKVCTEVCTEKRSLLSSSLGICRVFTQSEVRVTEPHLPSAQTLYMH